MQSLFDPNPRSSQDEVKQSDSPVPRLIVFLLLAILGVGGLEVYLYEGELARQKQERCDKAHAKFIDSLRSGPFGRNTRWIKEACGTERLTPEEQAEIDRHDAEVVRSLREYECEDALRQYGLESEVTKKHCPGTEVGKKVGSYQENTDRNSSATRNLRPRRDLRKTFWVSCLL